MTGNFIKNVRRRGRMRVVAGCKTDEDSNPATRDARSLCHERINEPCRAALRVDERKKVDFAVGGSRIFPPDTMGESLVLHLPLLS